ncbi:MAG: hypothetical protein HC917_12465 [Richelia sp. SM2_1_7]|nr:hypothetical protein [Richelia sp. SM2_1_7]
MLSKEQLLRLEQEKNSLTELYQLQHEKVAKIREAWVLETDASNKFKYEQQIKKEANELKRLNDRLDEIEKQLQSVEHKVSNTQNQTYNSDLRNKILLKTEAILPAFCIKYLILKDIISQKLLMKFMRWLKIAILKHYLYVIKQARIP